jgi:hypothetical protein
MPETLSIANLQEFQEAMILMEGLASGTAVMQEIESAQGMTTK